MSIYPGVLGQQEPPPSGGTWSLSVSEVQQPGGAPSSAIVGLYALDGNKNLTDTNSLGYLASSLSTTSETFENHSGAEATAGFSQYIATSTARRSAWGTVPDDYFRTTGLTLSALFRRVNSPATNLAVFEWVFADQEAWRVRCTSTTSIRIVVSQGASNLTSDAVAVSTIPLGNDTNWHHVVMTHDTSRVTRFYSDGVHWLTYSQTGAPDMHSVATNVRRAWGVGGSWNSNTTNRFGESDHVTILRGVYPPTPAA